MTALLSPVCRSGTSRCRDCAETALPAPTQEHGCNQAECLVSWGLLCTCNLASKSSRWSMLADHHRTFHEQLDTGRKLVRLWCVLLAYQGPEWLIYASAGFVQA